MTTINYRISLDLGARMQMSAGITATLMPLVNQAVNGIAQAVASRWIERVQRAKLWSGEKDAYAKSITYRMTGDFSAIVEADYSKAGEIETGRPARDLKAMLNTSMKVRQAKDGTRYLIIPFRHNTPGNGAHAAPMSPQVYSHARMLEASSIIGHGRRVSGTGAYSIKTQAPVTVRQRKYSWGERLTGPDIPRNQQGMVKMNVGAGGKRGSSYLTFRVMSEKSKGWIIPPQPGMRLAEETAKEMQPLAERIIAEAIKRSAG